MQQFKTQSLRIFFWHAVSGTRPRIKIIFPSGHLPCLRAPPSAWGGTRQFYYKLTVAEDAGIALGIKKITLPGAKKTPLPSFVTTVRGD